MPPLPLEASELRGQRFRCLPGCGFCCLCEPGLTPPERARFSGQLAGAVKPGGDALLVVGQAGPCALLSAERACTAYELRPRGCRSFPFHASLSWRAQVVLNRGCPGTWSPDGEDARDAYRPGEALPPGPELAEALARGRSAWAEFRLHARDAGAYEPPGAVRRRLAACLPLLGAPEGLAAGLALADEGAPVTARGLRARRATPDLAALERFLLEQAKATFLQRDAMQLPLFVDPGTFAWHAFRLRGGQLERLEILPDGALRRLDALPLPPLPLLPLDPGAARLRDDHARVLVGRDLLYGLAAYMLDRLGYGEPFASAALRELCAALGDLHARASLLARFAGEERVGEARMRQGIAFFDMDFLNSPMLGVAL